MEVIDMIFDKEGDARGDRESKNVLDGGLEN